MWGRLDEHLREAKTDRKLKGAEGTEVQDLALQRQTLASDTGRRSALYLSLLTAPAAEITAIPTCYDEESEA